MGNKLPHPFRMFVWICIRIVVFSSIAAFLNVRATDPITDEEVIAMNLVSGEGMRLFVEKMVTNFAWFAPFGFVLVIFMGVSASEKLGLLHGILRLLAFSVTRRIVLPACYFHHCSLWKHWL